MIKLVKLGGFDKPSMSKLYFHLRQAEEHWVEIANDPDYDPALADLAREILTIIETDAVLLDDEDPQNRWSMMKSDMALAGYVLDPNFHHLAPWTDAQAYAGMIRVTEKMLGINRKTGEHESDLMNENMTQFIDELSKYQAKLGQLSKGYAWSGLKDTLACSWLQSFGGELSMLQQVDAVPTRRNATGRVTSTSSRRAAARLARCALTRSRPALTTIATRRREPSLHTSPPTCMPKTSTTSA